MRLHSLSTALVLWALTATSAQAGVIYSNISSGFPNASTGYSGSYGCGSLYVPENCGIEFTAANGGYLASISIEISSASSPLTFVLYADSSGQPGKLLESWITAVPNYVFNNTPPVAMTTLQSVQNPLLSPGNQYWFLVEIPISSSDTSWSSSDLDVGRGIEYGSSLATLQLQHPNSPAVGIQVNSTPEPTSGTLFATGTIAIFTLIKACRRERNVRWVRQVTAPSFQKTN
jgi:hypothetical protein